MSQFLQPCPQGTVENIYGDCVKQQYLRPFFEYGSSYGTEEVIKNKCKSQMGRDCEKCGNFANAKIYPKCEIGYTSPGENAPYTECEYCAPVANSAQVILPRSKRVANLVLQQDLTTFNTNINKKITDLETKVVYLPDYNKTAATVNALQEQINSITGNLNSLLAIDINGTLAKLTDSISKYEIEAKKAVTDKGEQIASLTKVLDQVRGDQSKFNELVPNINQKLKDYDALISKFVSDRESEIELIDGKLSNYLDKNQVDALIGQKINSIKDIYTTKEVLDQQLRNLSSNYLTQKQFQTALDNARKF